MLRSGGLLCVPRVILCAVALGAMTVDAVADNAQGAMDSMPVLYQAALRPTVDDQQIADRLFLQAIEAKSLPLMERAIQEYRLSQGPHAMAQIPALQFVLQQRLRQRDWLQLQSDIATTLSIYQANFPPQHTVHIQLAQVRSHWHLLTYFNGIDQLDVATLLQELEAAYRLTHQALTDVSEQADTVAVDVPELLRDLAGITWLFAQHYRAGDLHVGRVQARHSGSHRLPDRDASSLRFGYREGQRALEQVVALYEGHSQTDVPELTRAYLELSVWHREFGYKRRADQVFQQAVRVGSDLSEEQLQRLIALHHAKRPDEWLAADVAKHLQFPVAQF